MNLFCAGFIHIGPWTIPGPLQVHVSQDSIFTTKWCLPIILLIQKTDEARLLFLTKLLKNTFSMQAFQLHGHPYTLYFFSLFWGHVFFAFHNLGTFCCGELLKLVWISVAKIVIYEQNWGGQLRLKKSFFSFFSFWFGDIIWVLIWGHPVFLTP
jgi:hypothetical protein